MTALAHIIPAGVCLVVGIAFAVAASKSWRYGVRDGIGLDIGVACIGFGAALVSLAPIVAYAVKVL